MLERASACLESSIWCSRNASKRTRSSKRLLHSAFWNHGATYLDLLPFAFDAHRRTVSNPVTSPSSQGHSPPQRADAPFLDFLYPAQALAFLSRTLGGSADHPRRRHVVGSRRYSSLPRPSHARDIRIAQLRPFSQQSPLDVLAEHSENILGLELDVPSSDARQDAHATIVDKHGQVSQMQLSQQHRGKESAGADRETHKTTSLGAFEEIIRDLSSPDTPLPRVRALWNVLTDSQKSDARLKRSLHLWLSSRTQHGTRAEAWAWSKEILSQISPDERSAAVYRSAISVTLKGLDARVAETLLHEARARGLRSDCGANILMRYYLRRREFDRAVSLMTTMRDYSTSVGESAIYYKTFEGIEGAGWHTSWLPDFMRYLNAETSTGNSLATSREIFARVASRFPRWIAQKTEGQFNARVVAFKRFLDEMESRPWATLAYEPMLLLLLSNTKSGRIERFSRLTAQLWDGYIRVGGVKSSKALMMQILKAWESDRLLWRNVRYKEGEPALHPKHLRLEWEKRHGRLDHVARVILSILAARAGDVTEVESLAQDLLEGPDHNLYPGYFWTYVFVHARRRDATAAQDAFDRIVNEFKLRPSVQTWDMLLHAYDRADDLEGALRCFKHRQAEQVRITPQSISSLLNLYAKLGDTDAIEELIDYARAMNVPIDTWMMNSLIVAHAQAGHVDQAKQTLEDTIKQSKASEISGSLRIPFNSVLTLQAQQKNFPAAISIYRQMKTQGVSFDEQSYASMVMALCQRRRPDSAWRIVNKVMAEEGFRPTAFHYTHVIIGFVNTREYGYAIDVYHKMQRVGIKPTIGTKAAYLKAKASYEHLLKYADEPLPHEQIEGQEVDDPRPLDSTIRELLAALEEDVEFGDKEFGLRDVSVAEVKTSLFEALIQLHGRRRCFDAAWQLFHTATNYASVKDEEIPPFRLVTAMMSVYCRAGEHEEVERCWNLLVQEANRRRLVQSPDLASKDLATGLIDAAEDSASEKLLDSITNHPPEDKISPSSTSGSRMSPHPAPAKRFLLSVPFRYLTRSFTRDPSLPASRVSSLLSTLLSLLNQSYTFDNKTWNTLIQSLMTLHPPRVLLAYTLTERFLTPNFPGWLYPSRTVALDLGVQNKSRRAEGMEYIAYPQRYVPAGERLPTYRTMVYLASGLLELRRRETMGWEAGVREEMAKGGELWGQVGSVDAVMRRAPKTVANVRELPVVYDGLQRRLIRGEGEEGRGERWYSEQG
ncbi:hypothetical protein KVT40_004950 [Elsinoe batatas]|uniref:PROP1-like PPR domain-containing protein n=1 Tax=Elsinoe batatas TaxID=2601811 RepID=A0A8K0PGE6_9PEZI|nr:hypothetical protein KVT40_004950 [Elsinoe batatas]